MWEIVVHAVATAADEQHWQKRLSMASPEQRKDMIAERERARQLATEERRHQEIVAAIHAAGRKPTCDEPRMSSGSGLGLGLGLGFLIGSTLD